MYAEIVLTEGSLHWRSADDDHKRAFQSALFPNGLAFSKEGGFQEVRTESNEVSHSIYSVLSQIG